MVFFSFNHEFLPFESKSYLRVTFGTKYIMLSMVNQDNLAKKMLPAIKLANWHSEIQSTIET